MKNFIISLLFLLAFNSVNHGIFYKKDCRTEDSILVCENEIVRCTVINNKSNCSIK